MPDAICRTTTATIPDSCVNAYTKRFGKSWSITDEGLSFIAEWESGILNGKNFRNQRVVEGFILTAYRDNRGFPTVGCGHLIVLGDHIEMGETITLERARDFLKSDISKAERAINSGVNVPLFKFEYDALVSVVYNCGAGNGASGLVDKINTGHYDAMFEFILPYRTHHNPNLKRRRFSEARLFAAGVYDAAH